MRCAELLLAVALMLGETLVSSVGTRGSGEACGCARQRYSPDRVEEDG